MWWFLVSVGCQWVDSNDCRVAPSSACEVYRPAGLLCGLTHTAWSWRDPPNDYPGALCSFGGETTNPTDGRDPCPAGTSPADRVSDQESSGYLESCVVDGNASRSSADLAEVPAGLACGLNTVGDLYPSNNLCDNYDPLKGECPPGYDIRFGRDVQVNCVADEDEDSGCPTEGADAPPDTAAATGNCPSGYSFHQEAHILVWCEVRDGCKGEGCDIDFGGVCGLVAFDFSRIGDDSYFQNIDHEVECQNDDLFVSYGEDLEEDHAAFEAGEEPTHSCLGYDLPYDECPGGLVLTCVPDCSGSGEIEPTGDPQICDLALTLDVFPHGGLCWCSPADVALTEFSFYE